MQTFDRASMGKQDGLTMISWIIVIAFIGFQGVLMMNVIPVYMNDSSVKSIMEGLATDTELQGAHTKKVRETMIKRFKINNLYDIKKEHITIKKDRNGTNVKVVYEPRGTLVGNLDYIVTFTHETVIPKK